MTKIKINGKTLDREFQNMAQALAFAYQNGECYGAKVVEIAQEGADSKGGTVGGFTQADIDAAKESVAKQIAVEYQKEKVEMEELLEARDAEIKELEAKLDSAIKDKDAEIDNADKTDAPDPAPDPVTEKEAEIDNADKT